MQIVIKTWIRTRKTKKYEFEDVGEENQHLC